MSVRKSKLERKLDGCECEGQLDMLDGQSMSWVLELPLTAPLSLNSRQHWAVKAREVKQLRGDACQLAKAAKVPSCRQVSVELHYAPKVVRRRDTDNLVATVKPAADGLVDAGVVPDDTPRYMIKQMPVIHPSTGRRARLWLVVTRLS